MINYHKDEHDNLVLTASNDGRHELAEIYRDPNKGYLEVEALLCETFEPDGHLYWPPESYYERFGWLTSAPVIAEYFSVLSSQSELTDADLAAEARGEIIVSRPTETEGYQEIVILSGDTWWYPRYAIEDPYEILKNCGRITFQNTRYA